MLLMTPWLPGVKGKKMWLGFEARSGSLITLNSLLLVFNYATGIITSLLCFYPFRDQGDFAAHSSYFQSLMFFCKAGITPLVIFLDDELSGVHTVLTVGTLGLSVGKFVYLFRKFPYYQFGAMRAAISWDTAGTWISIINALILLFVGDVLDWDLNSIMFLNLIPLPIITKAMHLYLHKIIQKFRMIAPEEIKSEDLFYKRIFSYKAGTGNLTLALNNANGIKVDEVIFYGHLSSHSESCTDSECICEILRNEHLGMNNLADIQHKLEKYFDEKYLSIFTQTIQKIRNHHNIMLLKAYLLLKVQGGNILRALASLYGIVDEKAGFFVKIKKNLLLKQAQRKLNVDASAKIFGTFDMRRVMTFYKNKQKFTEKILANTERYIDFWRYFNESNVCIWNMLTKSEAIESEADQIDRLWNIYQERHSEFYMANVDIYCLYLKLVRNKPFTANKVAKVLFLKKKAVSVNHHHQNQSRSHEAVQITEENLYHGDTIMLKISMSRERLGRISYISENIKRLLGFSPEELHEKDISVLMPRSYREPHSQLLDKHLSNKRKEKANHYLHMASYILNKKNYIQLCSIYVTVTPFIQNELTFIGAMRTYSITGHNQMLISEDGIVDGMTERLGQDLNVNPNKTIHITEICYTSETLLKPKSGKKVKWLSIIGRLSSENAAGTLDSGASMERKSPGEISRAKRRDRFLSRGMTLIGGSHLGSSTVRPEWQNLTFIRRIYTGKDDVQEEHIEYQGKITTQTLMERKIYVLALRKTNGSVTVKAANQNSKVIVAEDSGAVDIPNEGFESNRSLPLMSPGAASSSSRLLKSPGSGLAKATPPRFFRNNEKGKFTFEEPGSAGSRWGKMNTVRRGNSVINSVDEEREETMMKEEGEEENEDEFEMIGFEKEKEEKNSGRLWGNSSISKASTGNASNEIAKLEQAVYFIPEKRFKKWIILGVNLCYVICLGLLALYFRDIETNLNTIKGNTDMLNIGSFRLNRLLEFKRVTNLMILYKHGIIDDSRFMVNGVSNFRLNVLYVAGVEQQELLDANNKLREYLNNTSQELQNEIFNDLVPMKLYNDIDDEDGMIYLNTLDATNELVTRMARVSKLYSTFLTNNSDVDFIYNNVLDEMILSSEDIYTILVQDNNQNISQTRNSGIWLMAGALIVSILLCAFYLFEVRTYFTQRESFLNIFLRLDENEIDKNLVPVRNFLWRLQSQSSINLNQYREREGFAVKTHLKTEGIMPSSPTTEAVQGLKMRPKKASLEKNNQIVLRVGLVKIFILLMLIFPFVHILILMESKSSVIKSNINTILDVNNALYEIVLIYVSFYNYVFTNGDTTLRTKPIGEEWDEIYTRRMDTADFLSNLLITTQKDDTMSAENKEYISELINGNLCEVLPPKLGQQLCTVVSGGFLTKGIQSISIYTLNVLKTAKSLFDNSDRSVAAVKEVIGLKDIIDIEISVWQWQYTSYIEISNVFGQWVTSSIDDIENLLDRLIVFYCFWYLLIVMLFSYQVEKYVERKTKAWQKMCRKIPMNVVSAVKPLKFHLFRNGGSAFKSLEASVF